MGEGNGSVLGSVPVPSDDSGGGDRPQRAATDPREKRSNINKDSEATNIMASSCSSCTPARRPTLVLVLELPPLLVALELPPANRSFSRAAASPPLVLELPAENARWTRAGRTDADEAPNPFGSPLAKAWKAPGIVKTGTDLGV